MDWVHDNKCAYLSPYKHGMVPEIKIENDGTITVGDGIRDKTAMFRDIDGTVCNKKGATMGWVKLTHVAYSPGMKLNLCSLSKLCQDGWEMEGRKELLLTELNNQQIKCVIKVAAANGDVYCMYLKRDEEIPNVAVKYSIKQAHERLGHSHEDTI
jgi:hypothetical protein